MYELKIKAALKDYSKKNPTRFHMPGHKAGKLFKKYFPVADEDITELSFSDSLLCPTGIIKEAEDYVAEILGTKKTFFLTDGSTCGIFSMLYAVRERGSKIAINRNSHQSVYNACKLFGIEPIILKQNIKGGLMLPPNIDEIENALKIDDVIGVLLTYPDYYGLTCDLSAARETCDRFGKLLLIDGAHGGHLKFTGTDYAGAYADIYVDGLHKTTPCLTQGAILNVQNKGLITKVRSAVNIFRTTSPSYPIMASIEYAEKFMAGEGKDLLEKLTVEINSLKARLESKKIALLKNSDPLKLAVDFKSLSISPYLAEEELNKKNIFVEMNDGRYLLFLFSALTSKKDISKLEKALYKIVKNKNLAGTFSHRKKVVMGVKVMPYLTANSKSKRESVELKEASGRIVAKNVGVFPPCFPLCVAGEVMTDEIIGILLKAKATFGIYNGKISVVKNEVSGEKKD